MCRWIHFLQPRLPLLLLLLLLRRLPLLLLPFTILCLFHMIDTVRLYLETTSAPSAVRNLTAVRETINHDTGELHHYGSLINLTVRVNSDSLSIQGSLPKFHLGSNALTLTREGTARAIQHLSDALHLPMHAASVRRLDAGHNLTLQEPIACYLSALSDCRYLQRWERDRSHSLLYFNSLRSLARVYHPGG